MINSEMTNGESFFARQGALTREYFVYFKEKQRGMAEKALPFGRVVIFQTRPKKGAVKNSSKEQRSPELGWPLFVESKK